MISMNVIIQRRKAKAVALENQLNHQDVTTKVTVTAAAIFSHLHTPHVRSVSFRPLSSLKWICWSYKRIFHWRILLSGNPRWPSGEDSRSNISWSSSNIALTFLTEVFQLLNRPLQCNKKRLVFLQSNHQSVLAFPSAINKQYTRLRRQNGFIQVVMDECKFLGIHGNNAVITALNFEQNKSSFFCLLWNMGVVIKKKKRVDFLGLPNRRWK